MRVVIVVTCAALLTACAKSADRQAGAPAIALADVAGQWTMRAMPESSDSTLVTFGMVATADGAGWMMTAPNRDPIPMRVVAVDGDSIVTEAGPYESLIRPGVMVTTRVVNRLREGRMVGTFVARYSPSGADSVLYGRTEGTRAP